MEVKEVKNKNEMRREVKKRHLCKTSKLLEPKCRDRETLALQSKGMYTV